MTHCIGCPHLCHLHSHRCHHTPRSWRYSDDSHTQTVLVSKTYLHRQREKTAQWDKKQRLHHQTKSFKSYRCRGSGSGLPLTAVGLVRSVFTVILFVTSPAHGNTAATGTSEEVHRTFQFPLLCNGHNDSRNEWISVISCFVYVVFGYACLTWAVPLVRKVAAVVWAVALPRRCIA